MGLPVLIIGRSGSGKTTSMRNLTNSDAGVINVLGKALPFKTTLNPYQTTDYERIKGILLKTSKNLIVIDDAGYLITDQFMKNHSKGGNGGSVFELYNEIGDNFYELVQFIIRELPKQKIVYLMMHEDRSDLENIKPKTIGKLLDEKVCLEGMFTIVLRAASMGDKYVFMTRTSGYDVAKTPMDMFKTAEIDNDLKAVDTAIRKYYVLEGEEQ